MLSEKLRCADFVLNPPIITAVTQNHGDCQLSRHTPKITALTVIVIRRFSYYSCSDQLDHLDTR